MINFGIIDLIDIVSVACILYYIYQLMKKSSSANIFYGILVFIVVWLLVTQVFEMRLLGGIMNNMVNVGALALIILFQEEIRHFFSSIGTRRRANVLIRLFSRKRKDDMTHRDEIIPIVMACMSMSKQKVGALIVVERSMGQVVAHAAYVAFCGVAEVLTIDDLLVILEVVSVGELLVLEVDEHHEALLHALVCDVVAAESAHLVVGTLQRVLYTCEACHTSLLCSCTTCGSGRLLRFEVERLKHGVVGSSTISGSVGAFPPTQVLVTTQLHRHLCAVGKCDNLLQLLSRNGVGCGAECEEH